MSEYEFFITMFFLIAFPLIAVFAVAALIESGTQQENKNYIIADCETIKSKAKANKQNSRILKDKNKEIYF